MTMKVCCRQKNFSTPLKFWKCLLKLFLFIEAYLYVKNLTCCFESLWTRLTTSTWNDWKCYFYCFLTTCKKTNFITQLILEITLTICFHFGHVQACLSTPTWSNQLILFWTSNHIQKFNFIPHVFCEILWFKESCILRFLDHSSRTRFLQICCFGIKYKKNIGTLCWNKKKYLNR